MQALWVDVVFGCVNLVFLCLFSVEALCFIFFWVAATISAKVAFEFFISN